MSAAISPYAVKQALIATGNEYLFHMGMDEEQLLGNIVSGLQEFISNYQHRFGESPDPVGLLQSNPTRARAFFQIDTFSLSVEMKIMMWRIFSGCQITQLHFDYHKGGQTKMMITLRPPGGGPEETYQMQEQFDFAVIRHFAFGVTDNRLVLQGYYA